LEDAHTQARLEQEDAEERLSNLIARRDDLTQRITDATTRLPDAQARLESALRKLAEAEAIVTAAFGEGP
jgi:chromosome segregation ATPase